MAHDIGPERVDVSWLRTPRLFEVYFSSDLGLKGTHKSYGKMGGRFTEKTFRFEVD